MAQDQLDSILSDELKRDIKTLQDLPENIQELIDAINTYNRVARDVEGSRRQAETIAALKDQIRKLTDANKQLTQSQNEFIRSVVESEKVKQQKIKTDRERLKNQEQELKNKRLIAQTDKETKKELDAYIESVKKGQQELDKLAAEYDKKALAAQKAAKTAEERAAAKIEAETAREAKQALTEFNREIEASAKATEKELAAVKRKQNAYDVLNAAHQKLVIVARELGAEFGIEDKRFIEAAENANRLDLQLKAIDSSLGNHRRNVGNYASAWNGVAFSVTQLIRELPAAAYGPQALLAALSNNIGPLQDELKRLQQTNAQLIAQGKEITPVWKQVASALFNWQTGLTVAITLLMVFGKEIFSTTGLLSGLSKAQKLDIDLRERAVDSYAEQVTHLNKLKRELDDNTISTTRLHQIRNEIIKDYPALTKNLSDETNLRIKLYNSINAVTEALKLQAIVKASEELMTEATKKYLKGELDTMDILKGVFTAGLKGVPEALAQAGQDSANEYDKTIERLAKAQQKAIDKMKSSGFDQVLGKPDPKTPKGKAPKDWTSEKLKSDQDYTKALYQELQMQAQLEAENQKLIADDDKKTLNERLAAHEIYTQERIKAMGFELSGEMDANQAALDKIAEIEKKAADKRTNEEKNLLLDKETFLQKQTNLVAKFQLEQAKIIGDNVKFIQSTTEHQYKDQITGLNTYLDEVKAYLTTDMNAELSILEEKYRKNEITQKAYQQRQKDITQKYSKEILAEQIKALDEFLGDFQEEMTAAGVDVSQLVKLMDQLKASMNTPDKKGRTILGMSEAEFAEFEKIVRGITDVIGEMGNLFKQQSENRIAQYEKEIDLINQRKDADIRAIELSALSEEEKARKLKEIDAVAEVRREQTEAKIKAEKRKQAETDRAIAIMNIIVNTALAVAKALPNIPLALLTGALGAAQLATAIAAPIPGYEFGTPAEGHPGGPARIGEKGKKEIVLDPSGNLTTISKDGIYDLPAGSHVIPLEGLAPLAGFMLSPQMLAGLQRQRETYDYKNLERALERHGMKLLRGMERNKSSVTIINNGGQAGWEQINARS